MPWNKKEDAKIATVLEALGNLTVDELKKFLALLPTSEKPTRKYDIISVIRQHLEGEPLRAVWERLDETQKQAVSETVHSSDGIFRAERFQARYGQLPNFGAGDRWSYQYKPSLLSLFIYRRYDDLVMPEDLRERLKGFVPPPPPATLKLADEPPEFFELREEEYELADDDEGITLIAGKSAYKIPRKPPKVKVTVHQIPIIRRDTEREAQQDLQTVLRLIDKGKVAVSEKSFQPSSATMAEIAALLRGGDYYELTPKKSRWEQTFGSIKAFAWPMLVQAAKLAELSGKKLALTKAGRNALGVPAAETLRLLWQRWLKTKLLDEFQRIEGIKGQCGKGQRSMTAVEGRRAVIAEALKQCPVGSWVKFDEFSRYMQAAGFDFAVTRDPWHLYIADPHYGSLGYAGYHDWPILQGRYMLCFLFEYVATLGMIDVAYVNPAGVRGDYQKLWGTDDLEFLSRYDGLLYFRLNPLGAYCLGLTDEYAPSPMQAQAALTVLPSLHVNVSGAALSPDEALLLETWAEKESETTWRLDREKALSAVESGHQIAELHEFLRSRDEQPLPETVEGFITGTERRACALANKGAALLIECADAEIADLIAGHERTKKFCLRAGERHLAVKADAEEAFRKALHQLGYGMPRV
ncbi:MAG TPA: helicase-associated domain-containing protein [Blastocatellia bacterium]|nr:helicase-associated domain-containing protein [Blastocatellia bacterium]